MTDNRDVPSADEPLEGLAAPARPVGEAVLTDAEEGIDIRLSVAPSLSAAGEGACRGPAVVVLPCVEVSQVTSIGVGARLGLDVVDDEGKERGSHRELVE